MIKEDVKEPLRKQFFFFLIQISSTLITSIFLVLWVVIQFGVNWIVKWLQPTGVDQIVLWVFQSIFAVFTLLPVLLYYYVDTRIVWIRAQMTIAEEMEVNKSGVEKLRGKKTST